MSVITLKGDPKQPIPKDTTFCVEAYGATRRDGVKRIEEGTCTKSLSLDLDPGKYVVVFSKSNKNDPRIIDYRWQEDFFVDTTEDTFRKLVGRKPKLARAMATVDGFRWACPITGCEESMMTEYAMVKHEAMHDGFDLDKPEDMARFLGEAPPAPVKKAAQPATV